MKRITAFLVGTSDDGTTQSNTGCGEKNAHHWNKYFLETFETCAVVLRPLFNSGE